MVFVTKTPSINSEVGTVFLFFYKFCPQMLHVNPNAINLICV